MATFFTSMLGTVLVKVYYKETELQHVIERFEYVYDEEGDDSCCITFNTLGADSPNLPEFQDRAILKVIWGYVSGQTKERIVTVDDPKWQFDKNGRKLQLDCINKGVTAKQTRSKKMYKKTKLPDIAKEVAERQGLNGYMEVSDNEDGENKLIDLRAEDWKNQTNEEFREYAQIPQANKTDAQLLEEYGRKEPNGNWIVETRDDSLIIKKRNFSKKPHRAYTFEGGNGELFSFSPETKNKSKMGNAVAAISSHWNGMLKKYTQIIQTQLEAHRKVYLGEYFKKSGFTEVISTNPLYQGPYQNKYNKKKKYTITAQDFKDNPEKAETVANRVLEEQANKKAKGKKNVLGVEVDDYGEQKVWGYDYGTRKDNYGSDNTRAIVRGRVPVFGEDLIKNADADFKAKTGNIDANQALLNNLHDPTSDNEDNAAAPASNSVGRNNLKRNPATALVWGDVDLMCGIILSILNVGEKYEGNYWVMKCTHTIEQASGFTVSIEMGRNGHNIKSSTNEEALKKAGKSINKEMGQDSNTRRSNRVKIEQNKYKR